MSRSPVGWDDDATVAAWPGLAPLRADIAADACVVGLGASGLAAVEAFAARGLSVVGVDAQRVAGGASGRNGGFLLGGAALFLHDAVERWGSDAAVGIYRATLDELHRLADEYDGVRRVGSIRLAGLPGSVESGSVESGSVESGSVESTAERAERAAERDDIARHANALRQQGIAVQDYDGPLGIGITLPDDCAVNPATRAMHTAARLDARLFEHSPVREVDAGRVVTDGGRISAGAIVVAVDGGLELLLPQLAGRVRTARLQMLATEPVALGRLPCPVYGRWGYDYAQQSADGRLFVGGGRDRFVEDEWTHDVAPTAPVQQYLDTVARRMAGQPVTVTHRWAASVGFTDSGRPLCVEVAGGVIAIGGYNGTGNLVGPVAARAAVARLLDGVAPPPYLEE